MAGWFSKQGDKIKNYGGKLVGSREIETNHNIIRQSISRLFGWRKREIKEETFANAYARFGLNESKLKAIYSQFVFRFYLFLAFLFVDVFLLALFIAQGNWKGVLPSVGFFAICFTQVFISSFRSYQIKRRELVGFRDWFSDPDAWWPAPIKPVKNNKSLKKVK